MGKRVKGKGEGRGGYLSLPLPPCPTFLPLFQVDALRRASIGNLIRRGDQQNTVDKMALAID
jgi:hypothetical protein